MKFYKILSLLFISVFSSLSYSTEATEVIEVIEVIGNKPTSKLKGVKSDLHGNELSLLEVARSISVVDYKMIEQFSIDSIDDLITVSTGGFNSSYFGISGSLDIRASLADNYYRGMKRLSNPGTYDTVINPIHDISIVKGSPPPIFGTGRISGFINYTPALNQPNQQRYTVEASSYDQYKMSYGYLGDIAPIKKISSRVNFFTSIEDSKGFYINDQTKNSFLQISSFNEIENTGLAFDFDISHQNFQGKQVTGWNRITQDLIDHGVYFSGQANNLDSNDDGYISGAEIDDVGGLGGFGYGQQGGCCSPSYVDQSLISSNLRLTDVKKVQVNRQQVLIENNDQADAEVSNIYFGLEGFSFFSMESQIKAYYEKLNSKINSSFGYAEYTDSASFETKIILNKQLILPNKIFSSFQLSPSYRVVKVGNGTDFSYQYFDRRDISIGATSRDRILLATQDPNRLLASNTLSEFDTFSLSFASTVQLNSWLNWYYSGRYDLFSYQSKNLESAFNASGGKKSDSDSQYSYMTSISAKIDEDINVYLTRSENFYVNTGFASNISPSLIESGEAIAGSELIELGLKSTHFDEHLDIELAVYQQDNKFFNALDTSTTSLIKTKGIELSSWCQLTDSFKIGLNVTSMDYEYMDRESQFGYFGSTDLPQITDPSIYWGGTLSGLFESKSGGKKGGVPKNNQSLLFQYELNEHYYITSSISHVSSVASGYSGSLTLPNYTLANMVIGYSDNKYVMKLSVKNITDEVYFRSTLSDLFGNVAVLPGEGRILSFSGSVRW
ncbi:MAG: hypothetical protein ACPGTQ_10630 [Colwellia sp.]